jgi:electron transfer flavoprotein beta subunit
MNLIVLLKMAPDTVEELEIAADGKSLDMEVLRFKPSDPDEHAIEEAVLLKEKHGGKVTVVALDAPEVDEVLFTAMAKGADRAVKLTGELSQVQSFAAAELLAGFLKPDGQPLPPETLVLLRSQSIDDLEGEIGPFLAERLGLPYVCVVTRVEPDGSGLKVTREFAGGLRGELALPLPAVLGIQSAEKPPRYVPIAKVRAVMKSAKIETVGVPAPANPVRVPVDRVYKPEPTGRAQMLEGTPETVADKMVEVLVKNSLI